MTGHLPGCPALPAPDEPPGGCRCLEIAADLREVVDEFTADEDRYIKE